MQQLSSALRDYRDGNCSIEDLESFIETNIANGDGDAFELVTELNKHHAETPLERGEFESLYNCIASAETKRRTEQNAVDSDRTRLATTPAWSPERDASRAKTSRPAVGDVINGRFVLEEQIGEGGMSQVFKATDKRRMEARSREPHVAVKIMHVEGVDPGEAFIAMQREVQKSQSLTHPNIVRVNDFDRDGDLVYTTMELLDGGSLQERIARSGVGDATVEDALWLIREMGEALAYAHDNKIVHADFKPSNVFVTRDNKVKVIDFGIARALQAPDAPDEDKTVFDPRSLGALTPAYASPEMLEDLEPDPRDDIYALGCVAYELVTGIHPYSRMKATDARARSHPLRRAEGLNKHQWNALVGALQFDREKRTSTVREFLDQLERKETSWKPVAAGGAFVVLLATSLVFWLMQDSSQEAAPAGTDIEGPPVIVDETPDTSPVPVDESPVVEEDTPVRPPCTFCPAMVSVPSGTGAIGLPPGDRPGMFESPPFRVAIAQPFDISRSEVTVAEYSSFAKAAGGSLAGCRRAPDWQPEDRLSWSNPGFQQSEAHPVTCVSWQDAVSYTEWLSRETGEVYRLPSETEWEYVARSFAGLAVEVTAQNLCRGANVADQSLARSVEGLAVADCNDGYAYTAPATAFTSGALAGLRGNLFEWTGDCWNDSYAGAALDGSARTSGDCGARVLRGGSWYSAPEAQRLTYRNRFGTDYRSNTFGFRIVREISAPAT